MKNIIATNCKKPQPDEKKFNTFTQIDPTCKLGNELAVTLPTQMRNMEKICQTKGISSSEIAVGSWRGLDVFTGRRVSR